MVTSQKTEVVDYLTDTLGLFKKLKEILALKNKTAKIKGIASIIQVVEARVDSSLKYIKSGGYELFPITMQKSLYDPILEYLVGELQ